MSSCDSKSSTSTPESEALDVNISALGSEASSAGHSPTSKGHQTSKRFDNSDPFCGTLEKMEGMMNHFKRAMIMQQESLLNIYNLKTGKKLGGAIIPYRIKNTDMCNFRETCVRAVTA